MSVLRSIQPAIARGRLPWEPVGGGAAPLSSPAQLPGLHSWWHADFGVTDVGGYASAWTDQSGNVNDLSQGTAGNRPLITTTAAGKNALYFDNARLDFLDNAAVTTLGSTRPAMTFFAAIEIGTPFNGYRELMQLGAGGAWILRSSNNDSLGTMIVVGVEPVVAASATTEADGNVVRLIGTYSGGVSGSGSVTRNGVTVTDSGTTVNALASATPVLRVGGRDGTFGATGARVRTAGIYTRALAAGEIAKLDAYLRGQL